MYRLIVSVLLITPASAFAACDAPTSNADLVTTLESALFAYGDLELEKFSEHFSTATTQVECLSEPISRSTAAEFHRIAGLSEFLSRNSPAARKSFAAARAIEPGYSFPSDVIAEGNPVLEDYAANDPKEGMRELIPQPKVGSIKIDGSSSLNRSRSVPVIFQILDGTGSVSSTTLLAPTDTLPEYPSKGAQKPDSPGKSSKKKGINIPLLAAAGGCALAAGGLYGGAFAVKGAWKGPNATTDSIDGQRGMVNGLVIGSGVAGVAAVGLGVSSIFVNGRF